MPINNFIARAIDLVRTYTVDSNTALQQDGSQQPFRVDVVTIGFHRALLETSLEHDRTLYLATYDAEKDEIIFEMFNRTLCIHYPSGEGGDDHE